MVSAFSSGDLEMETCVCCSFWEGISACFGGGTDFKFEQNRGGGAVGGAPLLTGGGEITCCHLGTPLELVCSEHLFT